MQNSIIRLAILFFGALLQVSFLSGFISPENMPYVMVAYTVAITIIREFNRAFPWIILAALISDLFSYHILGESLIPLMLISYGVSFVSRKIWMAGNLWNRLAISFFGFGGAIFSFIYYSGMRFILGKLSFLQWMDLLTSNSYHTLIAALYTVIILALIYKPLEKIENHLMFYERKTSIKK
jgi:hypothetical protein